MVSVSLLDFFCTLAGPLRRHLNIKIGGSGSVLRAGPLAHLFVSPCRPQHWGTLMVSMSLLDFFCTLAGPIQKQLNIEPGGRGGSAP